ncbi:chromo' (CHRromatin Organization MOdifier) domain protein [Cooperia oncophora]
MLSILDHCFTEMSPKGKQVEVDTKEEFSNGAEADESYTVEKILATRRRAGRREYLIKWEGYPEEDATWEAECDCDCPDAIAEFLKSKPSRARGGKDDSTIMIGEQEISPKQSKGARRTTLSETRGLDVPKKSRRRTITATSNHGESASKKEKVVTPEEPMKDLDKSATQNGVRWASNDSDEGSLRSRFLKTKKIKEDVNSSTESSSYNII